MYSIKLTKCFFIVAVSLLSIFQTYGQKVIPLTDAGPGDHIIGGDVIIYGNFILRHLNFMKGGKSQYVILRNVETKENFSIEIIPRSKNTQNVFCCHIKPGSYELLNFQWAEDHPFYSTIYREPVFKNIKIGDSLESKLKNGLIKRDTLKRFTFKVEPGNLYYLGTWDFYTGLVGFSDEKAKTDKRIKEDYYIMEFDKALTVLPK